MELHLQKHHIVRFMFRAVTITDLEHFIHENGLNHKKVSEGGSTLVESRLLTRISSPFQSNFTKGERTP
jgi:hypothetical protein